MLNLKSNTTGSDVPIQKFQEFLYNKLKKLWPVDDATFDGYGRVYKNTNDKGTIPELFIESAQDDNTQYVAVYFDKTTKKALFFFSVDDVTTFRDGAETVKVSVIFITNIQLLKPALLHRGDEEVRNDVEKLCQTGFWQFSLTGTEIGFSNVFKSFTGINNKDGQVFEDRHPLFCFKINLELFYQPTQVNC